MTLFAAGVSMYFAVVLLARHLYGLSASNYVQWTGIVAGLVFMLNPWALARLHQQVLFLAYAVSPFLLVSFWVGLKTNRTRWFLAAGGMWAVASTTPHYIVFSGIIILAVYVSHNLTARTSMKFFQSSIGLAVVTLVWASLSAFWVAPALFLATLRPLQPNYIVTFEVIDLLSRRSDIVNVLRLTDSWFVLFPHEPSDAFMRALWQPASLVLPLVAIFSFLLNRRRALAWTVTLLWIPIAILATGSYYGAHYYSLTDWRFGWLFRGANKWTGVVAMLNSILVAMLLLSLVAQKSNVSHSRSSHLWWNRIRNTALLRPYMAGLIIAMLFLVYAGPSIAGSMESVYGFSEPPEGFADVLNSLERDTDPGKALYVPYDLPSRKKYFLYYPRSSPGDSVRWGALPPGSLFSPYFVNFVYRTLVEIDPEVGLELLSLLGVSHLVITDVPEDVSGDTDNIVSRLDTAQGVRYTGQFGGFVVYEVNTTVPDAWSLPRPAVSTVGLTALRTLAQISSEPIHRMPIVFADQQYVPASLLMMPSPVVFAGDPTLDLVVKSLEDYTPVPLFNAAKSHAPLRVWSRAGIMDPQHGPFHQYLEENSDDIWSFDRGENLVLTSAAAELPSDVALDGGVSLSANTFTFSLDGWTTQNPGVLKLVHFLDGGGDGLVLRYNMETLQGVDLKDLSGEGHAGTVVGTLDVDGKFGRARSFDATDDYVEVPARNSIDLQREFSMCVWSYKRSNPSESTSLVGQSGFNKHLVQQPDGRVRLNVVLEDRTQLNVVSTSEIPDNEWHSICGVWKAQEGGWLYVDGILESFVSTELNAFNTVGNAIRIGTRVNDLASFYDGIFDEVLIFDRALSQPEILHLAGLSVLAKEVTSPASGALRVFIANSTGAPWAISQSPLIPLESTDALGVAVRMSAEATESLHVRLVFFDKNLKAIRTSTVIGDLPSTFPVQTFVGQDLIPREAAFVAVQALARPTVGSIWTIDDVAVYDLTSFLRPNVLSSTSVLDRDGTYLLLLRMLRSPLGGSISVSVNGGEYDPTTTLCPCTAFEWVTVGPYDLDAGPTAASIRNDEGFNTINGALWVRAEDLSEEVNRVRQRLADSTSLVLLEAESDFAIQRDVYVKKEDRGLSNGAEVVLGEGGVLSTTFPIFRQDAYRLLLRVGSSSGTLDMTVTLNGQRFRLDQTVPSGLSLVEIAPIALDPGNVTLELSSGSAGESLLANPGFETATLYGWSAPQVGFQIAFDNSTQWDGELSLKVVRDSDDPLWWSWVRSDPISVTPGATYTLRTHMKAQNAEASHIVWEGQRADGTWIQLAQVPSGTRGDMPWTESQTQIEIPVDIESVRVVLNAGWALDPARGPAVTWFDAIHLKRLGDSNVVDVVALYPAEFSDVAEIFQEGPEVRPSGISVSEIRPERVTAQVVSAPPSKYTAVLTESFDPGWQLQLPDGRVAVSFPLYGVLNGFLIDASPGTTLTFFYSPQAWFEIGAVITLSSFIAIAILVSPLRYRLRSFFRRRIYPRERI
jgi:hypothetical protein